MSLFGGNILGSVGKGLQKGLQYEADFFKYLNDAVKHGRMDELHEIVAVGETFIHEVVDEATGLVKGDIAAQILAAAMGVGVDPMAGSRHKMQAIEAKWPKP